jgi:DNA uptake protein ComE-like DNA-binding protein
LKSRFFSGPSISAKEPYMKNYVSLKSVALLLCFALSSGIAISQGQNAQSKAPAAGTAAKAAPATPATPKELIDLNSATKQQLMTLPGIGDALSQKIMDNRPYRAKNELTQKKILTESVYEKISDLVIAKQGATPATPAAPASKASTTPATKATPATPATPSKAPASPPSKK